MCFRKLIFEDFGTHLDQNPVQSTLFRSFWCPTDTFSESFGIFSRCTISTFSFKHQILMFLKINSTGGFCRNSNFWAFWCSTELIFWLFWNRLQVHNINISVSILLEKTNKKVKNTFLHLTDPIKTKEKLNLFHF